MLEDISAVMEMSKNDHKSPMDINLAAAAKSLQLCPILWDPIDGSPPGSLVPGIFQARIPEWVAISFSNLVSSLHGK